MVLADSSFCEFVLLSVVCSCVPWVLQYEPRKGSSGQVEAIASSPKIYKNIKSCAILLPATSLSVCSTAHPNNNPASSQDENPAPAGDGHRESKIVSLPSFCTQGELVRKTYTEYSLLKVGANGVVQQAWTCDICPAHLFIDQGLKIQSSQHFEGPAKCAHDTSNSTGTGLHWHAPASKYALMFLQLDQPTELILMSTGFWQLWHTVTMSSPPKSKHWRSLQKVRGKASLQTIRWYGLWIMVWVQNHQHNYICMVTCSGQAWQSSGRSDKCEQNTKTEPQLHHVMHGSGIPCLYVGLCRHGDIRVKSSKQSESSTKSLSSFNAKFRPEAISADGRWSNRPRAPVCDLARVSGRQLTKKI